jgi:hypothetical protein
VFKETQLKVADLSKGQQIPWTEDGLLARFRFKEVTAMGTQPVQPQSGEAADAWNAIKDTENVAILDAFIARFRDTFYAEMARVRIEELTKQQPSRQPTTEPTVRPPPVPKGSPFEEFFEDFFRRKDRLGSRLAL